MNAEIITIGDEILIGQTIDTNSAWIAEQMYDLGIIIQRITTITDDAADIVETLNTARKRTNLIFVTGGLGPTNDDLTKETLTKYFGTDLKLREDIAEKIKTYFKSVGRPVLQTNIDQAKLPVGADIIPNDLGTASGMWFSEGEFNVISMPGVPYEMKAMMGDSIIPKINERWGGNSRVKQTVMVQGIGESFLAERIKDWEASLPALGIKLAYLPSPGLVRMRLWGQGGQELEEQIAQKALELQQLLPNHVYSIKEESLEEVIGKLLRERKETLSTAESCTGGYLAHLITSVSGSSDYYMGGIVSYANEVKMQQLGVSAVDLDKFGAVSREVVEQMAVGAIEKLNTTYAIATSGIAGPAGGTEEKPVGTVWIAVASKERVYAKKFTFGKNRERNIRRSALTGLNLLRKEFLSDV